MILPVKAGGMVAVADGVGGCALLISVGTPEILCVVLALRRIVLEGLFCVRVMVMRSRESVLVTSCSGGRSTVSTQACTRVAFCKTQRTLS